MAIISLKNSTMANLARGFSFSKPVGAFPVVPAPTFASATTSSYTAAITGYNAQFTYTVSASVGSAVRTDGNVTVSGLSANQSSTLTVTAANTARELSFSASQAFLSLPATPTLSRSGGTTTTVTVVIGNFDAGLTYTVGSTVGSATRSGNTITVTGLSAGQATTVTATASNASGNSAQGSLATGAVPATPTMTTASKTTSSVTFTITNYNAAYSYSVSSSTGSATRTGGSVTVSGLSEGQSTTLNVTATANSVNSAQGSITDSSSQLPTGGTITTSGSYRIHTFTSSGTFTTYDTRNVEYLLVAGGGASDGDGMGGYGGGGGMVESTQTVPAGSYSIVIGSGGANAPHTPGSPTNISPAIFTTAVGGGRGGANGLPGAPGGSGGGGGAQPPGSSPSGLAPPTNAGSGVPGQGFPGGRGYGSPYPSGDGRGAGGGGAGGAGTNASPGIMGVSGSGKSSSISGTARMYSGGGFVGERPPGSYGYAGQSGFTAQNGIAIIRYLI